MLSGKGGGGGCLFFWADDSREEKDRGFMRDSLGGRIAKR